MKERAYAKINLGINVINKREDGYHNMDMIMLPIDLHDEIEMEIASQDDYQCNIDLPYNEKNIIFKCVELLKKEFALTEQFSIKVNKQIPMQAGLAGGSSDGACAMRLINRLCCLNLSNEQLAAYGKRIGADIPFCVYSTPARVRGIGEIVEPFQLEKEYQLLLIKPEASVNTGEAFKMLNLQTADHPDMDCLQRAFVKEEPIEHFLGNTLLQSACILVPEVKDIMNECREFGFKNVMMSGSGSAVFAITDKTENIQPLYEYMSKKYPFVVKTTTLASK